MNNDNLGFEDIYIIKLIEKVFKKIFKWIGICFLCIFVLFFSLFLVFDYYIHVKNCSPRKAMCVGCNIYLAFDNKQSNILYIDRSHWIVRRTDYRIYNKVTDMCSKWTNKPTKLCILEKMLIDDGRLPEFRYYFLLDEISANSIKQTRDSILIAEKILTEKKIKKYEVKRKRRHDIGIFFFKIKMNIEKI